LYKGLAERYVKPVIGNVRLEKLTPAHVQRLVAWTSSLAGWGADGLGWDGFPPTKFPVDPRGKPSADRVEVGGAVGRAFQALAPVATSCPDR
jgi:hypothetical protein